ncbi:transporter substrate-binding domain-containing protein [Chitinimonas lacunae]|uniref:Transporter substrate-binding domain-containing protein n=1 Tax=Chitinimonas lacunae TaxID=1963018 RepID=A0ABV8MUT4_9NEIS
MPSIRPLSLALLALSLTQVTVQADQLDDIKARDVLVVGTNADAPPFGFQNPDKTISGYDVDFAALVAKKIGVKLTVQNLDPADRIGMLKSGKVDLIVATMTKTAERERQVDFSLGYFVTGQKVLAKKGRFPDVNALQGATIGVARGTTSETQFRQLFPKTVLISMNDTHQAVQFMQEGKIEGVTGDEPALAGLLNKLPNRGQYEFSTFSLSTEAYGIAVKKGEKRMLKIVNDALTEAEANGEATRIFNRWFGPNSTTPLVRIFKIQNY